MHSYCVTDFDINFGELNISYWYTIFPWWKYWNNFWII